MDLETASAIVQSEQGASASGGARDKETVKVVVRCRPLFGKEIVEGRKSIVTLDTQASVITIKCPENDQLKSFTFDSVYDENTTQRQFYDESGYPLVESIFEGYNGTIFAYGQTGCGKTHTMQGKESPPEQRGVIPHSFDHIFENINADPNKEYMVRVSYLEIYNEDIRDLLGDDSKKKLDLKESVDGSVYVKDLTEVVVSDVESINKVMMRGFKNRTIGATLMNEGSSRSHSIFTVVVETSEKVEGEEHFKAGKLNLVDLAGSERQSKTGATGNRLKEGCKINLSLSALGNVISALVDGKGKHIPYRDSKLTRLLQDSLGGNTKTLMVAAVSPADYNYDETLSTLRYANRAKNIKNKPIVNEDPKDAKLREYKAEIERLRKLLESQSSGGLAMGSASGMSTPQRMMTPQSKVSTPNGETVVRGDHTAASHAQDAALAKEREEITRYQQEATAMLEQAKRMMEEAKALQEQQAQQTLAQAQQPQKQEDTAPEKPTAAAPVVEPTKQVVQQPPTTTNQAEAAAAVVPAANSSIISPATTATAADPPVSPTKFKQQKKENDDAIAKALEQATKIDEQAKAMMAKAEKMMQEAEKRAKEAPKVKIVKEVVVKEVIPDNHVKEKEELKEMNQNILDQRDRMGKELERKQVEMEAHLREKEELVNKLKKIECKILGGASTRHLVTGKNNDQAAVDSEIALLKQQVEYRRAQIKLKEKIKKEAQYEAAKKALTLEKQMIEEELSKAQEMAQQNLAAAKKKESKYRAKLEAARQEVTDLNNEFERERENLLDTIREQTKEAKLLEQLVELFLPQNELVKVWERAVWNEEKEEWTLPKLKPRSDFQKLKLPALGGGNAHASHSTGGESGGAEVVSDEETPVPTAPMSGRATSSSGLKRRKSLKSHEKNAISNGHPPKPSSSNDASLYTSRPLDFAMDIAHSGQPHHLPAHRPPSSHSMAHPPRILSPSIDTGRLPSAVRSSRLHEPKEAVSTTTEPEKPSKKSKDKSDKPKKSKEKSSGSSTNPESPRFHDVPDPTGERFQYLPSENDLLAPLGGASDYQPRDRLASRQGSRQGGRGDKSMGASNSQSSLGEFDYAPPMERHAVGSRSTSRGNGTRRHETGDQSESHSPDASLIKRKGSSRSSRKKKDKHSKAEVEDEDEDQNAEILAPRRSHQPEDVEY